MPEIILASTSPRRIELIQRLGMRVSVIPPKCDEAVIGQMSARSVAETLAERKATSIFGGKTAVIGADTIVVLDGKILGKPKDSDDALHMLKSLSGRSHEVITGVCVSQLGKIITRSEISTVHFLPFNERISREYVLSGKSCGKAGAYGAQDDESSLFIEKIVGDITNVIGLPMTLLKDMLKSFAL